MYKCENIDKLEACRNRFKNTTDYPKENDLPLIYVDGPNGIDLQAEYETPYYDEIDINLISQTNTSSERKCIYSNYERVLNSIQYIKDDKCRPISVWKDGDIFYIRDGKHRYFAHIILGKDTIPVWISERVKNVKENKDFIQYKRNLVSEDGKISYPEDILCFYDENKALFSDIWRIEMRHIKDKKYKLLLTRANQDVIEISNGISAGNTMRSSIVAMELIRRCGYDIDETYIKAHQNFILEDKFDANNLELDERVLPDDIFFKIKTNIGAFENTMCQSDKINRLHTFLCRVKEFNTFGPNINYFSTGTIRIDNDIYYIISSEDKDSEEKIYSYVFFQEDEAQSNLKTKYIGRIPYSEIFDCNGKI